MRNESKPLDEPPAPTDVEALSLKANSVPLMSNKESVLLRPPVVPSMSRLKRSPSSRSKR